MVLPSAHRRNRRRQLVAEIDALAGEAIVALGEVSLSVKTHQPRQAIETASGVRIRLTAMTMKIAELAKLTGPFPVEELCHELPTSTTDSQSET